MLIRNDDGCQLSQPPRLINDQSQDCGEFADSPSCGRHRFTMNSKEGVSCNKSLLVASMTELNLVTNQAHPGKKQITD